MQQSSGLQAIPPGVQELSGWKPLDSKQYVPPNLNTEQNSY
jgi:hypothetical protein